MKFVPLSEASASFKVLVTVLLLCVGIGYLFGLIHIFTDVGFSYTGIVNHYRGSEKELDVPPEFAMAKLVHHQHVHVFGLSMLFFLVGVIFTLTRLPEPIKAVLVVVPYIGLILDMTSFWLLVFVNPVFTFMAMTFGTLMAVSFFLIIGRPLYEMWVLPVWHRLWGENTPWFLR